MYGAAEVAAGFSPMRVARWIGTSGAAGVKHVRGFTNEKTVRGFTNEKTSTEWLVAVKVNHI